MNNNEDLKLHSILDENIGKFGFADEAGMLLFLANGGTLENSQRVWHW